MWYEKNYRRHLCDMHIEDWSDEFLEKFSPEEYYENLVKAKIQTAMLYFQSHVGYSYYPTQSGHIHKSFIGREDAMKRLTELCANGNIKVVGYYSLIFNNLAYKEHPDRRMVDADGRTYIENGHRYGLCCPNNEEYRNFTAVQLKEIADYFKYDGMFFDMPFWPHPCYCPSCQARFQSEVGCSLPTSENPLDPIWQAHIQKRQQWMGEFAMFASNKMKELTPGVTVELNFASAMFSGSDSERWCTDAVNQACDYIGGDLYGGLKEQSAACKFYQNITKNQPFEYMTSRCNPDIMRHTLTKSKENLLASAMLTCAHHGAMLFIDAIDPNGKLHGKIYEMFGEIFDIEKAYEPHLNGQPLADYGVFYNLLRKGNLRGQDFGAHSGALEVCKTFGENHIPYWVFSQITKEELKRYKLIIIPYANTIEREKADIIAEYVSNGGTLYFSGAQSEYFLEIFLKAKRTGETKGAITYIAPQNGCDEIFSGYSQDCPLPFEYPLPIISASDEADVLATLTLPYTAPDEERFVSIHSNPPGIVTRHPAVIMKSYGKGKIIWSAAPIENDSIDDYKQAFLNLCNLLCSNENLSISSDAPENVEIISFQSDNQILISAVDLSVQSKARELEPFKIKVKGDIKSVTLLPDEKNLDFSQSSGYGEFTAPKMKIFNMFKIIMNKEKDPIGSKE